MIPPLFIQPEELYSILAGIALAYSSPRKERLLVVCHTCLLPENCYFPELIQQRSRGCRYPAVPYGHAQDGVLALRCLFEQWRILAKGLTPDTEPWLEANYRLIQSHLNAQNPQQAKKLLALLSLLLNERI